LIALACIWLFTLPVLRGIYNVYLQKESMTIIDSSVSALGSAVLAPGIYWSVALQSSPSTFPTVYDFGDAQYKFTILPGTNLVLNVEQD
jgi:hypothetical protein